MSWNEYYADLDDDDHDDLPWEDEEDDYIEEYWDDPDFGTTYPEDVEADLEEDHDMFWSEGGDF